MQKAPCREGLFVWYTYWVKKKTVERDKLYVVRKYIKAQSVADAIRKEPKVSVHEVYLDQKWSDKELPSAIGFEYEPPTDDYDDV